MSRLPIPHIINTIKTKLGFDRTMTASGEDVVDAVNKQSQQIEDLGPYNGLDSDSTTAALSAAQGKALNGSKANLIHAPQDYSTGTLKEKMLLMLADLYSTVGATSTTVFTGNIVGAGKAIGLCGKSASLGNILYFSFTMGGAFYYGFYISGETYSIKVSTSKELS